MTQIIAANMRHAAWTHESAEIGGGIFSPQELGQAAKALDAAERDAAHLKQALHHLHAILNDRRTATESWQAEQEARTWLQSIGSEPT